MIFKGRVWIFGDNIDTDVIIPARYLNTTDPKELASHCMEDMDPEFSKKVQPGDIIVGGSNFGCGSSREHAPLAIKSAGISCVIAESFARIFYRNSINIGLSILECEGGIPGVKNGDELEIDTDEGTIKNITTGEVYEARPFPAFIKGIINAGGLLAYAKGEDMQCTP
jgi:3-isopropylmalate/(R)-2-methylmalate dehydratase small subunit